METPNYRKASIYFDDDTVLEVEQRGGGGAGVGGDTGLSAVNLITGESTNDALSEKDETIAELQEELANVPTIEALNVTANGTYSENGKAYTPVIVNVASDNPLVTLRSGIRHTNNRNTDVVVPKFITISELDLSTVPANEQSFGLQENIPLIETAPGVYSFKFNFADSVAIKGTAPAGCSISGKTFIYEGELSIVTCDLILTFN